MSTPTTLQTPEDKNIAQDMIMISSLLYFDPIGPLPPHWHLVVPPFYSSLKKGYALTICKNDQTGAYAVGIRGSVMITTGAGMIDWFNDLNVLEMTKAPSPYPGKVSQGAWNGHKAITDTIPDFNKYIPAGSTVYVTGHSLGGSLVPLISLVVADQVPNSIVIPISFAAPSTSDYEFADYFNARLGSRSKRYWNTEDFIPFAWSDLSQPPAYINQFKNDPFLKAVYDIYKNLLNGRLCYVQVAGSIPLDGSQLLKNAPPTVPGKIGLMHSHATYLSLVS